MRAGKGWQNNVLWPLMVLLVVCSACDGTLDCGPMPSGPVPTASLLEGPLGEINRRPLALLWRAVERERPSEPLLALVPITDELLADLTALLYLRGRPSSFVACCVRAVRAANQVRDAWSRGAGLVGVAAILSTKGRLTAALQAPLALLLDHEVDLGDTVRHAQGGAGQREVELGLDAVHTTEIRALEPRRRRITRRRRLTAAREKGDRRGQRLGPGGDGLVPLAARHDGVDQAHHVGPLDRPELRIRPRAELAARLGVSAGIHLYMEARRAS